MIREVQEDLAAQDLKVIPGEEIIAQVYVIDRSIYEDNEIFAKNQLDSGMMTQDEYQKYLQVYNKYIGEIIPPDLMVIMNQNPKTLHERVMARGRAMEKGMTVEYLENLNHRYIDSLEPLLLSRSVRFIRQTPEGPKEAEEANLSILETIKKELCLGK